MKINLTKMPSVCTIAALLLSVTSLTSCRDNNLYTNPDKEKVPEVNQFFDFSTEKELTLSISYATAAGHKVGYEVFVQNPLLEVKLQDNEGNSYTEWRKDPEAIAIAAGFTQEGGCDNLKIKVPANATTLYFFSSDAGVPNLCTINAVSGNYNLTTTTRAGETLAETLKAEREAMGLIESCEYKKGADVQNQLYNLYDEKWYLNGAPTWSTFEPIDANVLDAYNVICSKEKLYEYDENGKKIKSHLGKTAEFLARHLLDRDFEVADNGEVKVQVLGTYCGMSNTLAYYVYEEANAPKTLEDLQLLPKYMVLPYAKAQNAMIGTKALLSPVDGSLDVETVALINPETKTTTFKAGTRLGFVIFPASYSDRANNTCRISYSDNCNYTTAVDGHNFIRLDAPAEENNLFGFAINYDNVCQLALSAKVRGRENYEVFGFEDQKNITHTDADFDDLVFGVSNIKGTENTGDPYVKFEKQGLLLFEDNWPKVGDYDMNDVVSEYHIIHALNSDNELVESEYNFRVLWAGATFQNAFSLLLPKGVEKIEDNFAVRGGEALGSKDRGATNGTYVLVCSNVLDYFTIDGPILKGGEPSYHFKAIFEKGTSRDASNVFNPFIISKGNIETHLIGGEPSTLMVNDESANWMFNTDNDESKTAQADGKTYWYAGANYLPFGINLVDTDGSVLELDFYKHHERKGIHTVFDKFTPWANREAGYENIEWWK